MEQEALQRNMAIFDSALILRASTYGGILAGQSNNNVVKIRAEFENAQGKISKVVISVGAALRKSFFCPRLVLSLS